MSELASEIRRIARGDKLKGPLSGAKDRDPINGTFVPFTNTPQSQITSNGAEGVDPVDVNSPPSNGAGEDPTDTDNQNDQPTDGNDPNTFNKGSATAGQQPNTYDMEDVIDQTGNAPTAPNEPDYSNSGEYSTGGIIDHLSGATDCATGQGINFHTDGNFPAPDGWEDAESPPTLEYYQEGYSWQTQSMNGAVGRGATPELAVFDRTSNISSSLVTEYPFGGNEGIARVSCSNVPSTCISTGIGSYSQVLVYRQSCSGSSDPEHIAICNAEPPTEEAWPEDGSYDLALIDGQLQTNQYDGEAPASAGGSKVDFCFGSGRTGSLEVTANGGFMVYETSGGAPTGKATVYGSDGTFQAGGDATNAFMDQWRPK